MHYNGFIGTPQVGRANARPARERLAAGDVRERMASLIAALGRAERMPFSEGELEGHAAMFPVMARWLGREEGERLLRAFDAEVQRLRRAG